MSDDIVARLRAIHCTGFRHDAFQDNLIAFKCFIQVKQIGSVEEIGREFAKAARIYRDAADEIERLRARVTELENK